MTLRRVPLFPLSTVLFPNMALSLHIFEPRYREMVNRCVDQDIPFGVLLIRVAPGIGGHAEPFGIGTMARITEVEKLDDGRLNILTVGVNRFRLHSLSFEEVYLTGEIEFLEEAAGEPQQEIRLARRVHALFSRYVQLFTLLAAESPEEEEEEEPDVEEVGEVGEEEAADLELLAQSDSHDGSDLSLMTDQPEMPRHPGALSYAVAAMAGWNLGEKQDLLELSSPQQRLEAEVRLLRRDIASMLGLQRLRAAGGRPPFIGPCSAN